MSLPMAAATRGVPAWVRQAIHSRAPSPPRVGVAGQSGGHGDHDRHPRQEHSPMGELARFGSRRFTTFDGKESVLVP